MGEIGKILKEELYPSLVGAGGLKCADMFVGAVEKQDEVLMDMLCEYCWEKLHTGHWKDVDIAWRDAYTLAQLLTVDKRMCGCNSRERHGHGSCEAWVGKKGVGLIGEVDEELLVKDCLRKLDEAVLMGGPLFRRVVDERIGALGDHLASLCTLKKQKTEGGCKGMTVDNSRVVEVLPLGSMGSAGKRPSVENLPSLEDFLVEYMGKEPCIINGTIQNWPASEKWKSMAYFKEHFGFRTVPVEVGTHYLASDWHQDLMTLSEFTDSYLFRELNEAQCSAYTGKAEMQTFQAGKKIGYLAQHSLFDQIPELKEDIVIPDYCSLGEGKIEAINAWLGPAGTVTPLHHDPHHNIFTQVYGRKYVRLYAPECSKILSPFSDDLRGNSSQIDLDAGEDERLDGVEYFDCVLEAGQALYMPPKWWHYVKALSTSLSVSFWWN